jgi:hypothetical protein
MTAAADYREVFRRAGERWLEGDAGALDEYEKGIAAALEAGDLPAALSAHQKLLVWAPADRERHERAAQAIAAGRDLLEHKANTSPSATVENLPLFSGVPREELVSVLTSVEPLHFAAGAAVVSEGEPGDSLFLVLQGTLVVTTISPSGDPIEVGRLGPGDFFGEVALLTGRPRTATVTAATETELVRLDQAMVEQLRSRHPGIDASLKEFHRRRAETTIEALLGRIRGED